MVAEHTLNAWKNEFANVEKKFALGCQQGLEKRGG
jgi:hypothetical protein